MRVTTALGTKTMESTTSTGPRAGATGCSPAEFKTSCCVVIQPDATPLGSVPVVAALRFFLQSSTRSFCIVFTLLLLTSANSVSAQNPSTDEAAIRENVKQLETGWNTKSGSVFAKPFAEDADYVVINGMHLQGRAAVETAHQQIFDTIFKDTTLKLTVKKVRFLRPDVAVVHVSGHRDGPTRELTQDAFLTLVMTKEKQAWTIVAFQNTQVQ